MKDFDKSIIGDIINCILGLAIIVTVIVALIDLNNRIVWFPYIMLMGVAINSIAAAKMKKKNNKAWIVLMCTAILLFIMALALFAGFGGF